MVVSNSDSSKLAGIPEFFENEIGECLAARTESLATFRELGPPDLCHIVKVNPKATVKEIGTYHYVLGADASSSATLAAYLNSLTYTIEQSQAWSGKALWKIKSGTYCSFDAFSRVDVRVEVRIPGGVECHIIDLRGEKHAITNPAIWSETAVSSVLRALLDDNDEPDGNEGAPLLGLRKLDPLPTPAAEKRFLEAASSEFWKGWQLGTDPDVQVATYFSNHLSNGIMKYFSESCRTAEAVKFFEPLFKRDPEVGAVLAKAYLASNQEISAVQCLYEALKKHPLSYGLLLVQIDFLRSKKKLDMALKLAKLAVTYAPSEYNTWAKLTEIYIEVGDYDSALLSLNSCPMFTFCEKDSHRMPPPARTHLPLKPDTVAKDEDIKKIPPGSGSVFDENDPGENEVHPELQRLPSLSLRGTFLKAYSLLIDICNKVGWDELLRHRSAVFVMEEEYRIHRALVEEREKGEPEEEEDEDDIIDDKPNAPPLPVGGRASNDSQRSINSSVNGMHSSGEGDGMEKVSLDSSADKKSSLNRKLSIDMLMQKIEIDNENKGEKEDSANKDNIRSRAPNPRLSRHSVSFSFKSKRLCEKWLDNLFMVLYNDLRLYTALKQEFAHYKNNAAIGNNEQLLYKKTGAEWEIYGDLAMRLKHDDDAKECFKLCLEQKFSAKSLLKLLEIFSNEGNIQQTLLCAVKLAAVMDRAYIETTYPSPISKAIFKLIKKNGFAKVQNALLAMNIPQKNYRMITRYFEYAEFFKVEGLIINMRGFHGFNTRTAFNRASQRNAPKHSKTSSNMNFKPSKSSTFSGMFSQPQRSTPASAFSAASFANFNKNFSTTANQQQQSAFENSSQKTTGVSNSSTSSASSVTATSTSGTSGVSSAISGTISAASDGKSN
ncbi:hypothetical protein HDU92_000851 [Lobulomyces angularis]|nr:hypothetical protein HDU92_000851 [Lobulomyces angularis]